MSTGIIKDSKLELDPMNTNNPIQECNSCRRLESTDRTKLIEQSSQIAALKREEIKLKSLHRRLEMRMQHFVHRTRKSLLTEEKLLNIEKRSQKELLKCPNTINHKKPSKDSKILWKTIQQIEEDNQNLEKHIHSLCNQIKQMEKDFEPIIPNPIKQKETKRTIIQAEDQLHRMNLELNKICTNNAELRTDVQRMLNTRREMIEEYNRLSLTMQNAMNESRQLTSDCSENFANRQDLVARMRAMHDQHDRDEKKLLEDIRELDRLLENSTTSKNFLLKKSNTRHEQTQLNELFAGKRSEGTKSAYTADEFRRLFRVYFDQDFAKEKVLNRTVETFLHEQEQSFTLFEYAVELINELNYLHGDLENKRIYIRNLFSNDNIDSFMIKDIFTALEHSVSEANLNVQSLELAKQNLRELLNSAYEVISHLFSELNCDRNLLLEFHQSINDRNILLYLGTIESRVQQLLPKQKLNRKGEGNRSYTDETTISWRLDHPHKSLLTSTREAHRTVVENLHEVGSITPHISSIEEIKEDQSNNEQILPEEIVNSVLDVYNECVQIPIIHSKNENRLKGKMNELKW